MAHDHKKFEKILRGLESQLSKVLASSGDHHHHHQSPLDHNHLHHQSQLIDHDDFEQKLAFVKTLLLTEIASKEPAKSDHLVDMIQKLEGLEATFRDGSKAASSENSSACSCTDSCFNDDGEAENDNESSHPVDQHIESIDQVTTPDPELLSEEENKLALVEFAGRSSDDCHETTSVKAVEYVDCLERETTDDDGEDDEERVDVKSEGRGSSIGGAVASGMVLGMVLMGFAVLTFSGCFQYGHNQQHYGNFLTPT